MTYTKAEPIKRYCKSKQVMCEDLISRAEAIEAIELVDWYHQNSNKDMVHGANDDEHQAWYKAQDIYKALEAVPSADRPMAIKCKPFLSEEDFKAFAEQVSDQNVVLIPHEAEVVSTNTSTNTSTKSTNISTDTSADRPRGEWIVHNIVCREEICLPYECPNCGFRYSRRFNFCSNCGADMRGEENDSNMETNQNRCASVLPPADQSDIHREHIRMHQLPQHSERP